MSGMTRQQFDGLMTQVLDQHPEVADIIITTGKASSPRSTARLKDAVTSAGPGQALPALDHVMAQALMGEKRPPCKRLWLPRAPATSPTRCRAIGRSRVYIFSPSAAVSAQVIAAAALAHSHAMGRAGLPGAFREMAVEKNGLILVTGGTGSCKSNSLAALIDRINETRAGHIVTLEDPVEFTHPHKKGTVNQRELGIDFDTFASGLRAAFRQGPKVILVGEIRDPETMEIALQAAGTGHLVLSTLHTTDAGATVNRILGLFSPSEERLVRMRLAESLRYVVSQRLLPREGGGRVAAFEVMKNTLRIKELILQERAATRPSTVC
jgi:twitching motility protein PilT